MISNFLCFVHQMKEGMFVLESATENVSVMLCEFDFDCYLFLCLHWVAIFVKVFAILHSSLAFARQIICAIMHFAH